MLGHHPEAPGSEDGGNLAAGAAEQVGGPRHGSGRDSLGPCPPCALAAEPGLSHDPCKLLAPRPRRRGLCALHHGPAGHPQQQPRAPARAAPPPLLRRPAAAPSAPAAVESQAPQWGASGDAARQRQELERLVAAGEAMRVPRDWAVESGAGTSSKAPRQQRRRAAAHASHAWPPAPYQHPTFSSSGPSGGSSSSSNAPPPKPVASQSAQEREQQQQQPADAEWCTHCRYPCSSSGLPTCEAGEYMRLWDADSHLKPAFFDSSWSGHLPCSSGEGNT